MKKLFYTLIWNLSEWSGIGLGRYAPYVFERMIGIQGVEVDSLGHSLPPKADSEKDAAK